MKKLAVANQKGGVGKTTLSLHIAQYAAERGKRVLIVDLDPQGSLSLFFRATSGLTASSLFGATTSTELPFRVGENLSILRADEAGLLAIDKAASPIVTQPRDALRAFEHDYDLCVIDTAGALGVRMDSALALANYVVTPVSVGLLELSAVAGLLKAIQKVKTSGLNPKLKHIGILPLKINTRSAEERRGLDELRTKYGAAIMPHILMERAAVKNAVASRLPVWGKIRGVSHQRAADEWLSACDTILKSV